MGSFLGALACSTLILSACPAAQTRPAEGGIEVKLRRIDVRSASYDQMELTVIVNVENTSAADVSLDGGELTFEIVGKGKDREGELLRDEAEEDEAEESEPAEGDEAEVEEEVEEEEEEEEEAEEDDGSLIDSSVDASGIANGVKITARAPSSGKIPAFQRTEVPLNLTWTLPIDDKATFEKLLGWRRVIAQINGTLSVGGKTETFGGVREVRAPNLPSVVIKNAQVASEDGGNQGAAFFDIGIENPNPFSITVDDFSYAVQVGGKVLREMEGARETVPPSSVQGFEENFQMTQEDYGAELRKIMAQNNVPYRLWGTITVRGITRPFEFTGDMQFPR